MDVSQGLLHMFPDCSECIFPGRGAWGRLVFRYVFSSDRVREQVVNGMLCRDRDGMFRVRYIGNIRSGSFSVMIFSER
jgi:hypothetical protein